jgi:hypothetical protein
MFSRDVQDAIERRSAGEIARCMLAQDFTLIEDYEEGMSDDEYGAMILEVDGYPALLAFTSEKCAGDFVATTPDLLGPDGTVPGFVVEGHSLFEYLPDGYGLILNPETEEECHVLPPDLAADVKRIVAAHEP